MAPHLITQASSHFHGSLYRVEVIFTVNTYDKRCYRSYFTKKGCKRSVFQLLAFFPLKNKRDDQEYLEEPLEGDQINLLRSCRTRLVASFPHESRMPYRRPAKELRLALEIRE